MTLSFQEALAKNDGSLHKALLITDAIIADCLPDLPAGPTRSALRVKMVVALRNAFNRAKGQGPRLRRGLELAR